MARSFFSILSAVFSLAILLTGAGASATTIDLGDAADYGLLTGSKETATFSGGLKLTGNAGFGSSSKLKFSGTNKITGNEYKDSGVTTTGSATVTGSTITQSMSQAIADANTASTNAAALAGTAGLTDQGGSISIASGKSVTIKALTNLSENVLNISSLSLTSGTLTFDDNGYTGAKFIINVTGNFTVGTSGSLKSLIQGINGATAADIIFNIEGTGNTVSLTGANNTSMIGTILAPSRNVSVGGNGTLTGALIAGVKTAGSGYSLSAASSGFNITDYAYKPPVDEGGGGRTPEPSSLVLYGSGLAALVVFRRQRRANIL
jgi:hypothetical protein